MKPPAEDPEGLPGSLPARIAPQDVSIVVDALHSAICAWAPPSGLGEAAEEWERLARLADALAIVARAYKATQQPLRATHWDDQSVTNDPCPGERQTKEARARPDVAPTAGAAGPRATPPEQGTPATRAPRPLVHMLSDPAARTILENLAAYSEDVRAALRVARALDGARSRQDAADTPLPQTAR